MDKDVHSARILMLFHGTRYRVKRTSILFKLGFIPTQDVVRNIKSINKDPRALPTVVADLEHTLPDDIINELGTFNIITAEYPPFTVYKSSSFFHNVVRLLSPSGMFAMWPGILTESKFPLSPTRWVIPVNPYKDMKARKSFAKKVLEAHPSLIMCQCVSKLLVFKKAIS